MSHRTGRSSLLANKLTPGRCAGVALGDPGVREVGISSRSIGLERVQASATMANERAIKRVGAPSAISCVTSERLQQRLRQNISHFLLVDAPTLVEPVHE